MEGVGVHNMSAILNPTPQPAPSGQPAKLAPALPPDAPAGGRWKPFLILGLVAGAAWAGYEFGYKPLEAKKAQTVAVVIPTTVVERGTLEKRTRIAGTTAAKNFATITAPMIRGPEGNRPMVLLSMVSSGAMVKQGEVIARIDGQSLQDHIDDVKDTVETALADLRKRKAELEIDWKNLEQTVLVAKADLDKARLEASAAEVRTEVERQLLQLSFEEAQARYKQLQSDFENTKNSQAADLAILNFTLERHKRHLARHESDVKRFVISAPMDGLAVLQSVWGGSSMRTIEQGDQVTPGQPFMKVVNPSSMMLEAKINQAESDDFRLGQTAEIRLDAFPGMVMKAKVFSIGAIATGGWRQNPYIRSIPLKLAIEGSDSRLIPDLSGSADVVLDQVKNTLVVPRQALYQQDGKAFVDVKTAQGFAARQVTVGLTNDTHASILSGLQQGEQIRLSH
jgi:HlyD family secretion protein